MISKQFLEFLNGQASVPDNSAHGKGIDWILSWYCDNPFAIGHDNMFPFSCYPKPAFLRALTARIWLTPGSLGIIV